MFGFFDFLFNCIGKYVQNLEGSTIIYKQLILTNKFDNSELTWIANNRIKLLWGNIYDSDIEVWVEIGYQRAGVGDSHWNWFVGKKSCIVDGDSAGKLFNCYSVLTSVPDRDTWKHDSVAGGDIEVNYFQNT